MPNRTPKEQAVLDCIQAALREGGQIPSVRDIAEALGYRSPSSVQVVIDRLVAEGDLIRREGKSRSLTLPDRVSSGLPLEEYDRSLPPCPPLPAELPDTAVLAFLCKEDFCRVLEGLPHEKIVDFDTAYEQLAIFSVLVHGRKIALVRLPFGGSFAVSLLDRILASGVKKVLAVGTCEFLDAFSQDTPFLPLAALRDEGASYHYLPPARWVETDSDLLALLRAVLSEKNLSPREGRIWTSDCFFCRSAEKTQKRLHSDGCLAVDSACASLAACARFRGVPFAQLFVSHSSCAALTLTLLAASKA